MPNPRETGVAVLASGRMVYVDDDGRAELVTCRWLVRVPTGNPEPDFPEDLYDIVECGLPRYAVDGNPEETDCPAGHHHVEYGSETYVNGGWGMREAYWERNLESSRW